MPGFTYEAPNEQLYLKTLMEYIKLKGEDHIILILKDAKCSINQSSDFSRKRWNAFKTIIYFYIPIQKLNYVTDDIKQKLINYCNLVMPKEAGLDIMDVKFAPLLVENINTLSIGETKKDRPTKQELGYKIFISYCDADKNAYRLDELIVKLDNYSDITEIYFWGRDSWGQNKEYMNNYIDNSDALILFCSPHSLESEPVKYEWKRGRIQGKIVLPVFSNQNHMPNELKGECGVKFDPFKFEESVDEIHSTLIKKINYYQYFDNFFDSYVG
ncbi:MAG TPA: toll/interleukin-1 receptor domain-containing protein [Candidatus Deferrimicrobium sp.]|nr:toll/interleukin-1 receptor domain-containing protein [Candidatus Deferrimicrobium sp.]